jgi:hypothetical protein
VKRSALSGSRSASVAGLILLAASACAPTSTPSGDPVSASASTPTTTAASASASAASGATVASRAATCETIESAKSAGFLAALSAATKIQRAGATQAEVSQAGQDLATAMTSIATSVTTAITQTNDPELKAAATEFLAQINRMITTIGQAAGDPVKIIAAFASASLEGIEQRVDDLCALPEASPAAS